MRTPILTWLIRPTRLLGQRVAVVRDGPLRLYAAVPHDMTPDEALDDYARASRPASADSEPTARIVGRFGVEDEGEEGEEALEDAFLVDAWSDDWDD